MVAKPEMLENRHLLVVDDVMTTGSTLSSILEIIEKTVPSVKLSVFTLALAQ
jgi:predicted amidophosphoribosyltransferase